MVANKDSIDFAVFSYEVDDCFVLSLFSLMANLLIINLLRVLPVLLL